MRIGSGIVSGGRSGGLALGLWAMAPAPALADELWADFYDETAQVCPADDRTTTDSALSFVAQEVSLLGSLLPLDGAQDAGSAGDVERSARFDPIRQFSLRVRSDALRTSIGRLFPALLRSERIDANGIGPVIVEQDWEETRSAHWPLRTAFYLTLIEFEVPSEQPGPRGLGHTIARVLLNLHEIDAQVPVDVDNAQESFESDGLLITLERIEQDLPGLIAEIEWLMAEPQFADTFARTLYNACLSQHHRDE